MTDGWQIGRQTGNFQTSHLSFPIWNFARPCSASSLSSKPHHHAHTQTHTFALTYLPFKCSRQKITFKALIFQGYLRHVEGSACNSGFSLKSTSLLLWLEQKLRTDATYQIFALSSEYQSNLQKLGHCGYSSLFLPLEFSAPKGLDVLTWL